MNFICVGIGGAIGAMLRYGISLLPVKSTFPVLTFVTNMIGALCIGFIVALAAKHSNLSEQTVLLLKTGFCGGFTTFSTFSLEALNLYQGKNYGIAIGYMVLSVICCVIGVWAGQQLVR